jgi:hypothetical protein
VFIASHTIGKTEQRAAMPLNQDTKGLLVAQLCLAGSFCVGPFHPAGYLDWEIARRLAGKIPAQNS